MDIKVKYTYRNIPESEMTIQEYVCGELQSSSEEGYVERAQDVADKTAKALGKLIDMLCERGQINLSDVDEIIHGYACNIIKKI